MESAKLSKQELIELIYYGVRKNNVPLETIADCRIETIIDEYMELCNYFQKNYVNGELDTFKRAACLLVATNRERLTRDKEVNAAIALDAAYKMCEKPYWNIGENHNIPYKMEEVNFEEIFEKHPLIIEKSREMLIASLRYENGSPMNYFLNLELMYQLAIQLKKTQHSQQSNKETIIKEEPSEQPNSHEVNSKPKRKILNIFKKKNEC